MILILFNSCLICYQHDAYVTKWVVKSFFFSIFWERFVIWNCFKFNTKIACPRVFPCGKVKKKFNYNNRLNYCFFSLIKLPFVKFSKLFSCYYIPFSRIFQTYSTNFCGLSSHFLILLFSVFFPLVWLT